MQTTKIYRLPYQKPEVFDRLKAAQIEAAKVWNECMEAHKQCRISQTPWLNQTALQKLTKSKYQLHSQSVQMVCQTFLANIDSTRANRRAGIKNMKYPWRIKRFYPVSWTAQAVKYQGKKLTLPMGRGRKPLSFKLDLDFVPGATSLVWNRGFELHIKEEVQSEENKTTRIKAAIDLGEIHHSAVSTNTGQGLIVSGRGIRSLKRQRNIALAKLSRKQSKCTKYSKRWKKLQAAKNRFCLRNERQIREYRHQATRQVVEFSQTHDVDTVFIGNPDGVRKKNCGRRHNQRMAQWEYGKDIDYLTYKFKLAGISVLIGSERGTSSTCPECGRRHKPKGRTWNCPNPECSYKHKHRDITGSIMMQVLAYGEKPEYPEQIKYLRPVRTGSSRCADTRQSNLSVANTSSTSMKGNQMVSAHIISVV
ncbi:MAG: transposase [Xenococcaceae cyanobacterium MO_207.B15]|nr:transposase [Xenococcaceae cyanobacterium MO_207.B15]